MVGLSESEHCSEFCALKVCQISKVEVTVYLCSTLGGPPVMGMCSGDS